MDSSFDLSMAWLKIIRFFSAPDQWADRSAEVIIAKPESGKHVAAHYLFGLFKKFQIMKYVDMGIFLCQEKYFKK
jgi:hypothetical protein